MGTNSGCGKEGRAPVIGIPASSELRKAIGTRFKEKFGIDIELFPSRGPENVTRIIKEYSAGVRYFDVLVAGGATPLAMVAAGAADDFQPYMILPEVKEPKNWWGGHIWEDNVSTRRYVYAFLCYTSETFWHNTSQVEPQEMRSFDDLLNPKWKGRIGFLDPRNPGSGQNTWAFLWKVKGEEFLGKLVQQDLLITQNQRQIAGGSGQRKARFYDRPQSLQLRTLYKSWAAGQTGAQDQRGSPRQQRQRCRDGGEESSASKLYQSIH